MNYELAGYYWRKVKGWLNRHVIRISPSVHDNGEIFIFPFRIVRWAYSHKTISFQMWLFGWHMFMWYYGSDTHYHRFYIPKRK